MEQGKTSTLRNELPVAPGPQLKGSVTSNSSQATAKYVMEFALLRLWVFACLVIWFLG